jgi:YYY domain-containing protein
MEYGAVVAWWVVYQLLLLAGLPLAGLVVPTFPDRGASLAIPAAVLVLVLPVYWVGHVTFGPAALLAGVGALVAVVALASRRGVAFERGPYLEAVAVFTLTFAFLVVVRAFDAGAVPGGGEKFLDFGLLKTLLRAEYLPPEDMWFAGERVRYYYGGHLIAATLAKLTATPGRLAYNLALAGFYAMEVTAAYGLASAAARDRGVPRRLAGALAAFAFGFASNLFTLGRLVAGVLPRSVQVTLAGWADKPVEKVMVTPETFSYWPASRVIPDTITEFPLFAYLNGDLHAHMMALSLLLLAAGVCYGYYRTPAERVWRRRGLVFGVLPVVAGYVAFVSTWSFPTVLGLAWLTLALAEPAPRTLLPGAVARLLDFEPADRDGLVRRELQRATVALAAVVVVGALAFAWVAPFVPNVLLASAADRGIAFLPTRTGMGALLLVHGWFAAAFALWLGDRYGVGGRWPAVAAGAAVLLAAGVTLDVAALAVFGPMVAAGWWLVRRDDPDFATLLVVAGAGVVVLVEFVYLRDNAAPERMNTVFKTYMQVWALWSVAAGVALARAGSEWAAVAADIRAAVAGWVGRDAAPARDGGTPATTRELAGAAFVGALVLSTSLYGGLALGNHFEHGHGPTLDAMEFAHREHPGEAEAIEWLDDRRGQPHIASAPTWHVYTWNNSASSLTGLPTIAGWAHEAIYRGHDAYEFRTKDVEVLYTGDHESRTAIVRKYDIEYVYVGPEERERYGDVSFADESGFEVAFQNDAVTIYAVNETQFRR